MHSLTSKIEAGFIDPGDVTWSFTFNVVDLTVRSQQKQLEGRTNHKQMVNCLDVGLTLVHVNDI